MREGILRTSQGSGPGSLYVLIPLCLLAGLLERLWPETQAFPCVWGGTVPPAVLLIQTGTLLQVSACCSVDFFVCCEHRCLLKKNTMDYWIHGAHWAKSKYCFFTSWYHSWYQSTPFLCFSNECLDLLFLCPPLLLCTHLIQASVPITLIPI